VSTYFSFTKTIVTSLALPLSIDVTALILSFRVFPQTLLSETSRCLHSIITYCVDGHDVSKNPRHNYVQSSPYM